MGTPSPQENLTALGTLPRTAQRPPRSQGEGEPGTGEGTYAGAARRPLS